MEVVLVILLLVLNFSILFKVFSFRLHVLNPTALFSLTVVTQMFPQLYIIFNNIIYVGTNRVRLLLVMLLSQIIFNLGYNFASKKSIVHKEAFGRYTFNYSKLMLVIVTFTIIGLLPLPLYRNIDTVYGGINVILGVLRSIGVIGMILTLIYIEKVPFKGFRLYILLFLTSFPLFYFSYFVKGSREGFYTLLVIFTYFLSRKNVNWSKGLSFLFFLLFFLSPIVTASMTDIRRANNYNESDAVPVSEIDFIGNLRRYFLELDVSNGMDLGNASLLMDNVDKYSAYDFGSFVWNGFVYNYFPARYFGDDLKEQMRISFWDVPENKFLEESITHGITTKTGYYDAYKSFSYFGCFFWGIIGYILGYFRLRSKYSSFFILLFVSSITILPNTITHGMQYMFSRWELFFLLFPFYFSSLKKIRTNEVKI